MESGLRAYYKISKVDTLQHREYSAYFWQILASVLRHCHRCGIRMLPKIVKKSWGVHPIIATNEELSKEKAAIIINNRADWALVLNTFLSRTRSYSATEASRTGVTWRASSVSAQPLLSFHAISIGALRRSSLIRSFRRIDTFRLLKMKFG